MSEGLALQSTAAGEAAAAGEAGPPVEAPPSFGIYRTVGRIAEGGMGMILRAEDMRGGPPVAIKTVRSTRAADAIAIQREIVTLSRVRHPGIVRLRGYGVQRGGPWIALELLDGRTLDHEMSRYWPETTTGGGDASPRSDERPTVPARALRGRAARSRPLFPVAGGGHLAEVFSIVQKLCLALEHLHASGIVHRDVKPANVFLGDDGRTTLIDYGLACAASPTAPMEGGAICVGTLEYAAPEQICGGPLDHRADIYSLGCLLYELVTGQVPFRGRSMSEIAECQIRREPIAPSRLMAEVPADLDQLILSMLAKRPGHRPCGAAEIGWRLARIERQRQGPPPLGTAQLRSAMRSQL